MEATSSAELFAIKAGMKAVDVVLFAHLVREPVNIFSNNTGKAHRLLEVHAASSRGDLIKVVVFSMEAISSAELFAIKAGMKAVDVVLFAHLVREPVNIFSNNTGKAHRLLEVHAASSRGDLIKVTFWNEDIDRLSPQLRQGALLRFKMFKAQKEKITSHKYRVGTFDIVLSAQRDSTVLVVTDKFTLKQLPLSNLCDIYMTVSARHRLCFEISQKFVSHDNDQGLIGYGTLYDANWSATNVTAQIVLRQNAPLPRHILAVNNRVIVQGTVGRSGSLVEVTAQSIKDVQLAKFSETAQDCALLPESSKSVSSIGSDEERILAKHINEFDGDQRSGYVRGTVLDSFEFVAGDFKGELLVEDNEVATLPVTLTQVALTEGQSFVTDARVQISGLLQYGKDRELEFTATANEVRFLEDFVADTSAAAKELPLLSAKDLFGMTASSLMGMVEGTLMKPFDVSHEIATGLLRVKGSGRSLLLRVSLQFECGANLSCSFERGSQLRLTGIGSREKENSSMLDIDVMSAADVCLQDAVDSPNLTPATTPIEAAAVDRSRLFQHPSTSNAQHPITPTSSKNRHTGNSPVKQETSPGVSRLVRDAIFEEAERNGKRRSSVLRELYHDTNKKARVLQIDSDSD